MKKVLSHQKYRGFTLVEIAIVIVVLGILIGIVTVGYGKWRESIAQKEVQSDLQLAAAAMENAKNFRGGYPVGSNAIPGFKGSPNVSVSYKPGGTQTAFCIDGVSNTDTNIRYFIDSTQGKTPISGVCAEAGDVGTPPGSPTIASVKVEGASAHATWNIQPGATSYEIQKKLSTSSTWDAAVSRSSTGYSYGGLDIPQIYDYRVRALNSYGASSWSATVTRVTVPRPGAGTVSNINYGCGNNGGSEAWENASINWTTNVTTVYVNHFRISSPQGSPGAQYTVAHTKSPGQNYSAILSSQNSWTANGPGTGSYSIYAVGPNGELSEASSYGFGVTYSPYEC